MSAAVSLGAAHDDPDGQLGAGWASTRWISFARYPGSKKFDVVPM
jgi:hypothetical protein